MISYLVYCLYILLLLYIRKLHNEPVLQHVGEAFDVSTQLFYSAFHTDQKIRADEHGKTIIRCCGEQSFKFHENHSLGETTFISSCRKHNPQSSPLTLRRRIHNPQSKSLAWFCQLPFREHIKVSGDFNGCVSQVVYISPERGGGCELCEQTEGLS